MWAIRAGRATVTPVPRIAAAAARKMRPCVQRVAAHYRVATAATGVWCDEADQQTQSERSQRYWRQRAKEEAMADQILVAHTTMQIGGMKYPCGAILPSDTIGPRNLAAMIGGKRASWQPRLNRHYPEPIALAPPAPPPKQLGRPYIVADRDPVESWRMTFAEAMRLCGGDEGRAEDWLMTSPECRELYKRAARLWSYRGRQASKVPTSVPPSIALQG